MKKRTLWLGLSFLLLLVLVLIGCPILAAEDPKLIVTFSEAPMLRELVEQGLLPPVEERLPIPEDIVILEPVEEIGRFGGTLRRDAWDPTHIGLQIWLYEPALRWNRDLTGYEPGVARGYEFSEDGTSITLFLRRGLRWSDGHPLTTEDIRFWWEDLAANPDFGEVPIPGWAYLGGERMTVDIIDEYTVRFNWAYPHWGIVGRFAGGFWASQFLGTPAHFLKQFHPDHNPEMEGDYTLLGETLIWPNPDMPVRFAWRPVEFEPGKVLILERNPFYWKVDTAGNQLPYIDRIVSTEVPDAEMRLMRLLAGEVDASFRTGTSDPKDIPVLLDVAEEIGIRHMSGWIAGETSWRKLHINMDYVPCEYIRELLRNQYFRRGLSHALDRQHIHEIVGLGMGRITGGTKLGVWDLAFQDPEGKALYEEFRLAHSEHDVALANQLLDKAGLDARCPATGWRLRADTGAVFELIAQVGMPTSIDGLTWLGLMEAHFEVVGIKTTLAPISGPEAFHNFLEGLYHLHLHDGPGGSEIDVFNWPDSVFLAGDSPQSFPMQWRWVETGGAEGWEPVGPGKALHDLFVTAIAEPCIMKRHTKYVRDAVRIWIDEGPFLLGAFQGMPWPVFVKENLRNVHDFGLMAAWTLSRPGSANPEQWFFRD